MFSFNIKVGKVEHKPRRPTWPGLYRFLWHGWDTSPSQGYPQQYVAGTYFIHLAGERQCGVKCLAYGNSMMAGSGC